MGSKIKWFHLALYTFAIIFVVHGSVIITIQEIES